MRIKIKCRELNKVCIAANMFTKAKSLSQNHLEQFLALCKQLEEDESIDDAELFKLQKKAK